MKKKETKLTKKAILTRIIEEEGSCNWILDEHYNIEVICNYCPFSHLKRRGENLYSCHEAVLGSDSLYTIEEEHEIFKQKAIEMLTDLVIREELLGQETEGKDE